MTATHSPTAGPSVQSPILEGALAEDSRPVVGRPASVLVAERLNASPQATALLGGHGRWTVKGPLSSSTASAIYKATCPGAPSLFLKLPPPRAVSASVQYEVLIKAHERLVGTPRLRVPTPYPFLLDQGFLVTEWIEGPAISQLLHSVTAWPRSVIRAVEQAGTWLRAFHYQQNQTHTFIKADQFTKDARAAVGAFDDWRSAPAAFRAHLALLERTRPMVERIPVRAGLLHGDFKPANMIISRGDAVAVDLSATYTGGLVSDLVQFLIHIDLGVSEPRGFPLLPWGRALEAAFLRGYDPEGVTVPHPVLAWWRLQRALRLYQAAMENENNRIRGALRKACYARCAGYSAFRLRRLWEESPPDTSSGSLEYSA
jgi:aminoglycoside phosphotransferase (APT) family kinase protein